MILRPYQQKAIDMLNDWLAHNCCGAPCLVMPTGSGKSHVIAFLCKDAVEQGKRVLMLTHVKELIEQNASKLLQLWPDAPVGFVSAGMGRRDFGREITFAGIQTAYRYAKEIGHVDLCVIDEAHLVNHKDTGMYRNLIKALNDINPTMRVIGLTATPYRLGHGLITDKPAIFDDLIEPVTVAELVAQGYLAPLRSKVPHHVLDVSKVKKRGGGGDFVESELQAAVDTDVTNRRAVDEILQLAGDRRAWLIFCVGVRHAQRVRDLLRERGVTAEAVTGDTPKTERERIINAFKAGRLRALTNANVLTTGFDYPDIDLIAMLRPTMSPALYVQMAGRGMRLKSHTDHCLVLDFAGNVLRHGPITCVQPPTRKGKGGDAPVKVCPVCRECVHASCKKCLVCGTAFETQKREPTLRLNTDVDIMGSEPSLKVLPIFGWHWREHISRKSGKRMIVCVYYGKLQSVIEFFPLLHGGFAQKKAVETISRILAASGARLTSAFTLAEAQKGDLKSLCDLLNSLPAPSLILYRKDKEGFFVVEKRSWRPWRAQDLDAKQKPSFSFSA